MKRITDIPNISKEMMALYAKIIGLYGNFKAALPIIDAFLEKYPNYHEALIVKAQALMAIGRNSDALRYIKMAKRVDKRRLIGCFDEAEIYLEKKKIDDLDLCECFKSIRHRIERMNITFLLRRLAIGFSIAACRTDRNIVYSPDIG